VSDAFFQRPPEIDLAGLLLMARDRDRAEIAVALASAPERAVLALSPDLARSIGIQLSARWVVDAELVPFSWELRGD
jgi:hypothetical protein